MNTKKIIVPFLLISSVAFADIQVDSIKKEKSTKDFAYEIVFPELRLNKKLMKDANKTFYNEYTAAAVQTAMEGKELKKAGSSAKAETKINFEQYNNSFGVTSIVTNNYFYTGGANGAVVLSSYNFDNTTGKVLKFNDIFNEKAKQAFEKGILQIVKNNKSGKYFSETNSINLDDAVMYFDGDYIVFKFQEYQISPGSSGNPAFRYHKDAVKSFFKYEFNSQK